MPLNIYRNYCIKCYLNSRHFIIFNGNQGEVHPHTWEFSLYIKIARGNFIEFSTFEKAITEYLLPYQNVILNEKEPFESIIPTLENMTDYFSDKFYEVIRGIGGVLLRIEASETPTRSYILDITDDENDSRAQDQEDVLSVAIDNVLDNILEQRS